VEVISRAQAKRLGEVYYFTGEPCAYGHIAKRAVRNYTCTECDDARKRGAILECTLSECRICGADVRAPGHATCSTECRNKLVKAKERANRELKHRKRCHGCGEVHYRFHKWFCSDECYRRHRATLQTGIPKREREIVPCVCVVCARCFVSKYTANLCSEECRNRRLALQRREAHIRQRERGYIAEYGRKTRAKVSAAVAVARDLGIVPQPRQMSSSAWQRNADAPRAVFGGQWLLLEPESGFCRVCGCRTFGGKRGPIPKYCSRVCLLTFLGYRWRNLATKSCPHCGAEWCPNEVNKSYCSDVCRGAALRVKQIIQGARKSQQQRRRERNNYAIMLAFKRMGLLEKGDQT
jgi:hypothetical protein